MNWLEHLPALIVVIPLMTAFLTPLLGKVSKKGRNLIIFLSLSATLILVWTLAFQVLMKNEGKPLLYVFGSSSSKMALPSNYEVPVRIIFEVDGISAFMAIITSLLSLLSFIYSLKFMEKEKGVGKFYSLFLLLTAGIFGLEFTGDLFNLFVFLEITSIAACSLIAFRVYKGKAVMAGFKTMVMYSSSTLLFLLGVGLLYGQYDILNIGFLSSQIRYGPIEIIALSLFIAALALKAGIFPLHFWVPDAYGNAPSPISMFLVINTQASLYALFRICFTLYGLEMNNQVVGWLLVILGLFSMIIGITMALPQRDLKKLIAFIAVSQTGYMLLGVGVGLSVLGTPALEAYGIKAMTGGIFHIFNDALCIGLLFLVIGGITFRTRVKRLNSLSGLAREMKYTALFFMIAALGISGVPPFNGFVSKLIIYESVFKFNPFLSIIAILMSIITLAVFILVFHSAFLGPKRENLKEVKDAPKTMLMVMFLLALLIITFGLFPGIILNTLVKPAVNSLINQKQYLSVII